MSKNECPFVTFNENCPEIKGVTITEKDIEILDRQILDYYLEKPSRGTVELIVDFLKSIGVEVKGVHND